MAPSTLKYAKIPEWKYQVFDTKAVQFKTIPRPKPQDEDETEGAKDGKQVVDSKSNDVEAKAVVENVPRDDSSETASSQYKGEIYQP